MTTAESALPTQERYAPPPAAREGALVTSQEQCCWRQFATQQPRYIQQRF